jgi:hypothetical protein
MIFEIKGNFLFSKVYILGVLTHSVFYATTSFLDPTISIFFSNTKLFFSYLPLICEIRSFKVFISYLLGEQFVPLIGVYTAVLDSELEKRRVGLQLDTE